VQGAPFTNGYVFNYSWVVPESAETGVWTIYVYSNDSMGLWSSNTTKFTVSEVMVTSYNFSAGAGTDKWAYEKGSEAASQPATGPNIEGETQFLTYTEIASPDTSRYSTNINSGGYYGTHHFRFNITQQVSSIDQIYMEWRGYGTNALSTLYVWNFSGAGSWQSLGTGASTTADNILSHTFTSGIEDLVGGSELHIVATSQNTHPAQTKQILTNFALAEIYWSNQAPEAGTPTTYDNLTLEPKTLFGPGDALFANVSVTDPDGKDNVDTALITILNTTGGVIIDNATMNREKELYTGYIFNYSWALQAGAESGNWTIWVYTNDTSNEWAADAVNFTVDSGAPQVNLERPIDYSGDADGNVVFHYNVSDDSEILNCSLYVNGAFNASNASVDRGISQNFTVGGLGAGRHNWTILCYDSLETEGSSEIRYLDVVLMTGFGGRTTDISLENVSAIKNFTLENEAYGLVNFTELINLSGGADLNLLVSIGSGYISVDTKAEPRLNRSATLTLYGLGYEYKPIIMEDGAVCAHCDIGSYEFGTLEFNATHFTNFSSSENSNLSIWDQTDPEGGNQKKSVNEQVVFYANYINKTSGAPINGTGVYCEISFSDNTDNMTFNATSGLYEYNRTFGTSGNFWWEVLCNGSSFGYETLNLTDTVAIGSAYLEVEIVVPPTIPGQGDSEEDSGYLIGQDRVFVVRANVTCREADCGNVQGFIRYNFTSASPDANISAFPDTPFHIVNSSSGSAENPILCGVLDKDQSCVANWTINATGALQTLWKIDAGFNATNAFNTTEDIAIRITKVLIMSLSFDEVGFGVVNPATSGDENPSPDNGNQNVQVHANSNNLEMLWIKGTDLDPLENPGYGDISYMIGVGNVTWSNQSDFGTSKSLTKSYQLIDSNIHSGTNYGLYFWIAAPGGLEAQDYEGKLYILANATG
ncbi:MAG: hypothetical protein ACP5E4_00005, partial [Candidatus Aenigmatarchaeota archaeon]